MNDLSKEILKSFEQGEIGFNDMEVMHASVCLQSQEYTEFEVDGVLTAYTLFESPVILERRRGNQGSD